MKHYFERLKVQIISNWNKKALGDYCGESFTFGEMATIIEKFHLYFSKIGIKKGDTVGLCARNQARWGLSFLAANTYGAVVVPILVDFTPESICKLTNHAECRILFTDEDVLKKLDVSTMPTVEHIIVLSDLTNVLSSVESEFSTRYPEGFSASDVDYPTDNDKELAVINYTSGSTGEPKGVMIRYECFSANVEFGHKRIPSYPTDNLLSILPMAHMFGMAFELIYPICGGTTVYFLGKAPSPSLLLRAMREIRPYLVIAVPMVFEKIYRSKLKPKLDNPVVKFLTKCPVLSNIIYSKIRKALDDAFGGKARMYIMGGAAVNPEVEEFLHRIKFHFTVGYGMTEAAPLMAYEDWDKFILRSCGKPMDFVQLRIDSEDPQHVAGEIQAKGTNIFSGYFKNESATKAAFTEDGWFNTGDLGLIDADGNIFIKGRSKSMLLSSNGQNIYPEEIECQINSLPHVVESLVLSREGKLIALVYPDEETVRKDGRPKDVIADEICSIINAKLPKYSQISHVELEKDPFKKTPKLSIKRFLYK